MVKRRLLISLLILLLSITCLSAGVSVATGAVTPTELVQEPSSAFTALSKLPVWKWTTTRMLLYSGQRQIGDVYIAQDRLLKIPDEIDDRAFDTAARRIGSLSIETGVPVTLAVIPDAAILYENQLSALLPLPEERQALTELYGKMPESVTTVNLYTALNDVREEHIFYRTDEHWTSLGAYYGYAAICRQMGLQVLQKEKFTIRYMEHEALGGLYRQTAYGAHLSDSVDFYQLSGNPAAVTVTIENPATATGTVTERDSIYRTEYLSTQDFPAAFLGPEADRITITMSNSEEPKGKLLLIGDLSAHTAAQFLIQHYDEITILPTNALIGEIDATGYQQILILTDCTELQNTFRKGIK